MGRRALRKIDPSIDLTGHLKTLDQLRAHGTLWPCSDGEHLWRWKSAPARDVPAERGRRTAGG